jgi:hypothetical protein
MIEFLGCCPRLSFEESAVGVNRITSLSFASGRIRCGGVARCSFAAAKACDEFRRLTIDASAAELKQEKSLVAELRI